MLDGTLAMKAPKKFALVLLGGATLFVLFNLWVDSQGDSKAYYASIADAQRDKVAGADAFDRGWLPVVLKSGVTDIREEHNVSTNRGRATFHYTPDFVEVVERDCSPLPPEAPINSPFANPFRRWPDFLQRGDTAATLRSRNITVFNCSAFTVALNEQSGFFWR
jgi:hypothetical protein